MKKLFRIGLIDTLEGQEIHLGFSEESDARLWVLTNNLLALEYKYRPMYCFLGEL